MKLIVPHNGEVPAADARLMRLAEFLGIQGEPIRLEAGARQPATYLEQAMGGQKGCLLVNPAVMKEWLGGEVVPEELVSYLAARFAFVLVHAVTADAFTAGMVAALSGGGLTAIDRVEDAGQAYEVAKEAKDVCGAFAGLRFGPVNPTNDRVFGVQEGSSRTRRLIDIAGRPLMALAKRDQAEFLFLGSQDTADVDRHAGYAPLNEYFSQFVPQAMALRYMFGEECWRPEGARATVIIDDPLLRRSYGFLNFESLLGLMREHHFHTSIAFIPYNYRRNSARTLRMFGENREHFSLCFHGNDHTQSEFASHDSAFLRTAVATAEERMRAHEQATGLYCDRVMVFPQAEFSEEAMRVLRARNFCAGASSGPYPLGQPTPVTLGELCQPAVLRYGDFPLFLRAAIRDIRSQDIALNAFFGRPVLTVEHHDLFQTPERLVETVERINSVVPDISWCGVEKAVSRSFLRRRAADGTLEIRAYAPNVTVVNRGARAERLAIAWAQTGQGPGYDEVLRNGSPFPRTEEDKAGTRVVAEAAPGESQHFMGTYRCGPAETGKFGYRWAAKAFVRRRLSEVRDNFLSKNPQALKMARTLKARFLN